MDQNHSGLLYNAVIHCMDPARTAASAVYYNEGIIRRVGTESEVREWLAQQPGSYAEKDCQGACILPGFIDTHLHPMLMAIYEHNVDLIGVKTIKEISTMIQQQASKAIGNEWILALQLEEQGLDIGQLPDRWQLDKVCSDKPLVIFKRDGHSIAVNSKVIALCGLEQGHSPVAGGTIELDDQQRPTGIFKENAVGLVMAHFVSPGIDQLMESTQRCFGKLSAQGITSIGAILQTDQTGPSGASGSHELVAMTSLAQKAPFSIYSILIGEKPQQKHSFEGSQLSNAHYGHKIGAFKIFADGTLGSCTACMHQSFFDQPNKTGYLTLEEGELYQKMLTAHLDGWQICIHAIGDKAVATCVQLYRRLLTEHPKSDHRHRIEHASIIDDQSLIDIAELELVLCCQPLFIRSEQEWLPKRLGPERCRQAYPFKSIFEAGITMTGSSDAPIENISVLEAIETAVTREGFQIEQALSIDQALALYTCNAAFAQFEEQQKGSIETGKNADLVILSQEPHSVIHTEISNIEVLTTISRGKMTYNRYG